MNDLYQLTQLGGTVVVVIGFLLYLQKKDEANKKMYESFNNSLTAFNKTLTNHLHDWIRTQKEFTDSQKKLAKNLQTLTNCIKDLKKNGAAN